MIIYHNILNGGGIIGALILLAACFLSLGGKSATQKMTKIMKYLIITSIIVIVTGSILLLL